MTPDTYKILQMAVEDGIALGVRRAFKYTDEPSEDQMVETIRMEVMTQICEWFYFNEEST